MKEQRGQAGRGVGRGAAQEGHVFEEDVWLR